jgi:uncharacterized membrane protein YoaK (UPF0700 family)
MFRHQGPGRSDRHNRILAGYLAFLGGFVNSAGFILIGSFSSHVTGSVGRLANDVVAHQLDAAAAAASLVLAFFGGALVASVTIESDAFGRTPDAYGSALSSEAFLLVLFTLVSYLTSHAHPRVKDAEAAILCAAMGMQNALMTRLSGAVVRTTHLTGVVTDLGIEAARWLRWGHLSVATRMGVVPSPGRNAPSRPAPVKVALLATIAGAFTMGALAGATAGIAMGHAAMLFPASGVAACAVYAFASGRGRARDSVDERVARD